MQTELVYPSSLESELSKQRGKICSTLTHSGGKTYGASIKLPHKYIREESLRDRFLWCFQELIILRDCKCLLLHDPVQRYHSHNCPLGNKIKKRKKKKRRKQIKIEILFTTFKCPSGHLS